MCMPGTTHLIACCDLLAGNIVAGDSAYGSTCPHTPSSSQMHAWLSTTLSGYFPGFPGSILSSAITFGAATCCNISNCNTENGETFRFLAGILQSNRSA